MVLGLQGIISKLQQIVPCRLFSLEKKAYLVTRPKTGYCFSNCLKLFNKRWNSKKMESACPQPIFIDCNLLADQAYNFSVFEDDAWCVFVLMKYVLKEGTDQWYIFFIFQTFMTGENDTHFCQYPKDFSILL